MKNVNLGRSTHELDYQIKPECGLFLSLAAPPRSPLARRVQAQTTPSRGSYVTTAPICDKYWQRRYTAAVSVC